MEGVSGAAKDYGSEIARNENVLVNDKTSKHSFSDDSDLASLAREFEEEEHVQESPYIRKVIADKLVNQRIIKFAVAVFYI